MFYMSSTNTIAAQALCQSGFALIFVDAVFGGGLFHNLGPVATRSVPYFLHALVFSSPERSAKAVSTTDAFSAFAEGG
jgi:hypothetical protein